MAIERAWRLGRANGIGAAIDAVAAGILLQGGAPRRVLLGTAWVRLLWEGATEPDIPLYPYPSGWRLDTPAGMLPIYFLPQTEWLIGVDEIEPTVPGTR